jgi:hypothetical protein
MSIVKLKNPKTSNYDNLKKQILDHNFKWTYIENTISFIENENQIFPSSIYKDGLRIINNSMYTHIFLRRPGPDFLYPKVESEYMDNINEMYCDIFNSNRGYMQNFNLMNRCSANAVEPSQENNVITMPHIDHPWKHANMLIYLTDAGGSTFVEGEEFAPEEDDVIIFQGQHWHELPKQKRRVVLVMTYI